jgi:uncharacterized protein
LVDTKPAIVITGAAAGIGREFARLTAAEGRTLVVIDRDAAGLEALCEELVRTGIDIHAVAVDLTSLEAGDTIEAALTRHSLHCESLINNAGLSLVGPAANLEPAVQLRLVDLHVMALTDLTLRFLPGMIARRHGGIINVSSMGAYIAGPNMAIYNATKRYVSLFTAALARELIGTGVRICSLVPGKARTGMWPSDDASQRNLIYRLPMISAGETAAAGWRGFKRGKTVVFPQLFFHLAALVLRLVPTRTYLLLTAGMFDAAAGCEAVTATAEPAVVITGAASPLGSAFARLAAAQKRHVVLVGDADDELDRLAETLAARCASVSSVVVDMTRRDAGAHVERALSERGLCGDVLVHGTQASLAGPITGLGREAQLDLVTTNIRALTDLTLHLLPSMIARRRGGVILFGTASGKMLGRSAQGNRALVQATRAYATWLGEALACETRQSGVTIGLSAAAADADPEDAAAQAWQRFQAMQSSVSRA